MKLNATYTPLSDTNGNSSVDPAYLAPTFDLLSDDSDVFTSTTKIIANSSTTLTYMASNQTHMTTGNVGISMDLGSLKTVKSLRIKGLINTSFNNLSNISVAPVINTIYVSGVPQSNFVSTYSANFKPGRTGIYNSNEEILAGLIPVDLTANNTPTACNSLLTGSADPTAASYGGYLTTASTTRPSYKIQYSLTGASYLDFLSVPLPGTSGPPYNQDLDLNVDLSSLGSIRYIRLLYTGSLVHPRANNTLHLSSLGASSVANRVNLVGSKNSINSPQISLNGVGYSYPKITFIVPAGYTVTGILYRGTTVSNNTLTISSVQATNVTGNLPLGSSTNITDSAGITHIFRRFSTPVTTTVSTTFTVNFYNLWSGNGYLGYYHYFAAVTEPSCLSAVFPGNNITATNGPAINSITLSEFYADDGVVPPTVTFSSNSDRNITATSSTITLSESWSVTSGNTAWTWEKQEAASTTWTSLTSASGSGTTANLTLTSISSGDSGDKYRVRVTVGTPDGALLGNSRITTIETPQPTITINSTVLPSSYQLGDPPLLLSVAASVSPTQTLSYKWQKKNPGSVAYVDLSTTSPTLTIPTSDLELVDSGVSYKVIVSSAGANDVSREVTITVTQPLPTLIIDALIDNNPSALFNNVIEEGQTLKLNVSTKNVDSNVLYWKIASVPVSDTTPTSDGTSSGSDIDGGVLGGVLNLSASTTNKTASLALIVFKDNITEGNELLQVEFYTSSSYSSTSLLGRSSIFTIKDTSTGTQPAPSPTPSVQIDKCFEIGFKNLITKTPTRTQTPTPTPTITRTPAPTNTRTPRPTPPPTNEPTRTPPASPTPTKTPPPTRPIEDCANPSPSPSCPECMTAVIVGKRKIILTNGGECWDWIWDCVYIPDCEPTAIP